MQRVRPHHALRPVRAAGRDRRRAHGAPPHSSRDRRSHWGWRSLCGFYERPSLALARRGDINAGGPSQGRRPPHEVAAHEGAGRVAR
eukprot:2674711-Pyramimonas_sp.AAC.1